MSERRSPSRLERLAFIAASATFLALAGYSLWLNRSATAAIAGALSFAFLLLLQLPYLESMEVLTLKVKLRERLSDAERLTDQLRTTASVSARLMYVQLAFMNRMGSIPWARKRSLLAEVEQNLSQLNVPKEQVDEYKRPFLNVVSFDLYLIFKGAMDEILGRYSAAINTRITEYTKGGAIPAHDQVYENLLKERTQYQQAPHNFDDVLADPRLADLKSTVGAQLARYELEDGERMRLETIGQEIVSLSDDCWQTGTITVRAEEYLNKYGRHRTTRLNELEGR